MTKPMVKGTRRSTKFKVQRPKTKDRKSKTQKNGEYNANINQRPALRNSHSAQAAGIHRGAVITLALGIGASTAIFTVVDAALIRGLPYKSPIVSITFGRARRRRNFAARIFLS